MIEVNCCICERELEEAGGLLFGPPDGKQVVKEHICVRCWPAVCKFLDNFRSLLATPPPVEEALSLRLQVEKESTRELERRIALLQKENNEMSVELDSCADEINGLRKQLEKKRGKKAR